jgi:hypothetical protein
MRAHAPAYKSLSSNVGVEVFHRPLLVVQRCSDFIDFSGVVVGSSSFHIKRVRSATLPGSYQTTSVFAPSTARGFMRVETLEQSHKCTRNKRIALSNIVNPKVTPARSRHKFGSRPAVPIDGINLLLHHQQRGAGGRAVAFNSAASERLRDNAHRSRPGDWCRRLPQVDEMHGFVDAACQNCVAV